MLIGFRAAFSTIINEWVEREGKEHDRKVIDLMLAHVSGEKVEGAYNRAAYMQRRRELALIWAENLPTRGQRWSRYRRKQIQAARTAKNANPKLRRMSLAPSFAASAFSRMELSSWRA